MIIIFFKMSELPKEPVIEVEKQVAVPGKVKVPPKKGIC